MSTADGPPTPPDPPPGPPEHAINWQRLFTYLLTPFPKATGFSPYRSPGPSVHAGFLALFVFLGSALSFGAGLGWPAFAVWLVAGSYLGRDLTILAHYSAVIGLPGIALFIGFLVGFFFFWPDFKVIWQSVHAVAQQEVALVVALTALVGAAQLGQLVAACREPAF
jgi:hypothetical protein